MSMFLLEGKDLEQQKEIVTICITWCWIYAIYPDEIKIKDNGWVCLNNSFQIRRGGIECKDANGLVQKWYHLEEAVNCRENFSWLRDRLVRVEEEFKNAAGTRCICIFLTEEQLRAAERRLIDGDRIYFREYTGV